MGQPLAVRTPEEQRAYEEWRREHRVECTRHLRWSSIFAKLNGSNFFIKDELGFGITSYEARATAGVLNTNMSAKKTATEKKARSPDKQKSKEGGEPNSKKPEKATEKETKNDQKGVQKGDPKDSQKVAPKDAAAKASQKDVEKNAPKANKDVKKETQKDAQKLPPKDDAKDVPKDAPKDTNKDDEKDESVENHMDFLPDDDEDAPAPFKEPRPTSKISPDNANILREIIRRQLEDEGYVQSAASLPANPQRPPEPRQTEQLYAPPLSSSEVAPPGPSGILDFYARGAATSLPVSNVFGSCSCHPACNCQKPCLCNPSPCPCKGPSVSSIHGSGSGTLISSVVPIPIPYPVPSYDGGAGASGSAGTARSNEPIIINQYQPSTSSAPPPPPAPADTDPTSVHDVVSLMTKLMLKKFRDDLLRQWGLPVPSAATNAPAAQSRHPVPGSSVMLTPQALQAAVPGQALVAGPAPSLPLQQYVFQQPSTMAPYVGGQRPLYTADQLSRMVIEPRTASAPATPRRRHHTGGHKHTATGRRADELEGIESPETPELSAQTGSRGSKGPRSKGSRRGRK